MLIDSIEWQAVAVPFKSPFRNSLATIDFRYSLLVTVRTDTGVEGIGEAPASLARSSASLRYLSTALETAAPALLAKPLDSAPLTAIPPRSLAFALETAALDCLARSQGKPVVEFLGGTARKVEVNAVIPEAGPEETAGLAARAAEGGFSTVKLKVGGRDLGLDVKAVSGTRDAVGDSVKLRLDANRAWPETQAATSLGRLGKYGPEFIEEPVSPATTSTLARLRSESTVPIAADESVEDLESATGLIQAAAADFLVIKLARVGGISSARSIAARARDSGVGVTITSSLEAGVGLAAALHLAAALDIPHACGLATGPLLTHDLLRTPLVPTRGQLEVPAGPGLGVSPDPDAIQRFALGPGGQARLQRRR